MKTLTFVFLFSISWSNSFGQNRKSIDSLKHELTIVKQDTSRVFVLINLSGTYRNFKPDSAQILGENALALATKINYVRGKTNALSYLSSLFRIQGDIPKSLKFRFKALEIMEDNPSLVLLKDKAGILNGIGLIYLDMNDHAKALAYFRRSVANDKNPGEVKYLMNIEKTFRQNNQLDSAWYYAHKVYEISKTLKINYAIAEVFMDMGIIQFRLNNRPIAFDYLRKSLANLTNTDRRLSSDAHTTIAGFFKEINQPDSSIFYAVKGLAEGQAIHYQKGVLEAGTLLAALYESRDLKKTLDYYKIARSANDELYGIKKVQALQSAIADEEERQKEIEVQKIDYQNQLKQYLLLAGLSVFSLIAFILYRNNRQKQKANAVLEKTLTTLKATQTQLIQKEKLASLGELTAGIAHEIQNPLNFVNNFSEVSTELVEELKEGPFQQLPDSEKDYAEEILNDLTQNLQKITHHGGRASSIVKGMLEHSRMGTGERIPTDLNKLADEYLRLAYHGMKAKNKDFQADFELLTDLNLPLVNVVPQEIGRVLLNLLNNAFYAVNVVRATRPFLQPKVIIITEQQANHLVIKVEDNGGGIPESVKAKIFQPFFTTKPTGEGTGLGLSLSYDIVTKGHGGTIEVKSTEGEGSEFVITLPIE